MQRSNQKSGCATPPMALIKDDYLYCMSFLLSDSTGQLSCAVVVMSAMCHVDILPCTSSPTRLTYIYIIEHI